MKQVIHQFNGKTTYNGQRIYIDKSMLSKAGFQPGTKFNTTTDPIRNTIEFLVHEHGSNTVSKKTKNKVDIPVIDKQGRDIREALEKCDEIKVTFVQDRVIIEGIKKTSTTRKSRNSETKGLKTISFCAGSGISTECMKKAGFEEVAAVEWNPKEGSEDKFSDIYLKNHPESIMFNLPMQQLKAADLPYADVWIATLDCV
ncbi:DNA cytosine methyltransferase [Brevibacillus sp. NPDC058079]|uniref:DNA cytosine methyltransferase n=1 Tax=Brevibacillus sp. NPDC058079 TaxID=3346330 RepID=UPI0036EB77B1